jgi:hypothetical protein
VRKSVLLLIVLVGFAVAQLAAAADCSTNRGCLTCMYSGGIDSCDRTSEDAYCSCTVNIGSGFGCIASGSCDYTGAPPCAHPTPEGECPSSGGFAPTIPDDHAAVTNDESVNDASETSPAADGERENG